MPITAVYVARGMVRSGSFASSRKIAVASNPMNAAMANISPTPGDPDMICVGSNGARDRPSAPPRNTIAATRTSTMPTSPTSITPSTLLDRSMCR